jgi:hypothetical protein
MVKHRPARRCSAHRSDGEPCRAWSIVGGYVCRSHGGGARHVREAARRRVVEAQLRRGFDVAWSRYLRETAEFHAQRIATVAELLGIPPHKVGAADIRYCRRVHGRPRPIDDAPVLRHDWRYGPRLPTKRRD